MKLVVDASPLILLIAAEKLSLLPNLANEVVVPEAVLGELESGKTRDHAAARLRTAPWAKVGETVPISSVIAGWDLGLGESAVLGWAASRPGFTCVLDDRAARNCALTMGLPFVGTLGLVLAAKEAGFLPAARPVLAAMMRAGYYLSDDLLERALRGVGE
ncbi:MAG: DUF3368 domain-containing protein [Thermoanaerobaculia bacterium]|nr:DUF3368 domain-containing protein [Thermoanaerobaculia bacterium]